MFVKIIGFSKKCSKIFNDFLKLYGFERLQYQVFFGLSTGVIGLTGILFFSNRLLFQRFLGSLNPLGVFFLIVLCGAVLLPFLLSQGWFAIFKKGNPAGWLRSSKLAALFGLIIILVDLKIVFPADMNIEFPESLLFYPVIGFLVEFLFHVLPFGVLLFCLTKIIKRISIPNIIWISILIVSLLEPIYQTAFIGASNQYPLWAVAYVGVHVFLFNLSELFIFVRYDFIAMYTFRLVYYLIWHIFWGHIRLHILF